MRSSVLGRDPRAAVDDPQDDALAHHGRAHRTRPARRPVADRVLEQVGERALELRGVGLRASGSPGSTAIRDRAAGARRGRPRRRGPPPRARPSRAAAGRRRPPAATGRAACRPGREAPRLLGDRRARAPGARSRLVDGGVERLARRHDRRQRRAQVVRDGAQHRGLDLVAAPQRPALDELRLERARGPASRPAARRARGPRGRAARSPRPSGRPSGSSSVPSRRSPLVERERDLAGSGLAARRWRSAPTERRGPAPARRRARSSVASSRSRSASAARAAPPGRPRGGAARPRRRGAARARRPCWRPRRRPGRRRARPSRRRARSRSARSAGCGRS